MLRNVLGDYLDRVTERQFDLPFILLLPTMGFYDVHFTHGHVEFGKDFIAKRREDGKEIQYSFQSKAGDIGYTDWRNHIYPQLFEAVTSTLTHPNFSTDLPHQAVLVATGDLKGNAGLAFREFNTRIVEKYGELPIQFWGKDNLLDALVEYGLTGIHHATATGYVDYARFFLLYGRALQGNLPAFDIEEYSRQWLDASIDFDRRLLRCAIEGEVFIQQSVQHGRTYEAIFGHLARLRALSATVYIDGSDQAVEFYAQELRRLHELCVRYLTEFRDEYSKHRDLIPMLRGAASMTTYLAQCSRIMDVAALVYFTAEDEGLRSESAAFLGDIIQAEPGCSHPLSDRYAISLVLATLVLLDQGRDGAVRHLLQQATIWLCDRYEQGMGLAPFGADEVAETRTLLGYAFDFIELSKSSGSFLATTVSDLAAFLGDKDLYSTIVNDIKACRIHAEYWQPHDSVGVCSIEGGDVITYPSVEYEDVLTDFSDYQFAEHIRDERATFRFVEVFGPQATIMHMVFLRDRYFPKLWPYLALDRRNP